MAGLCRRDEHGGPGVRALAAQHPLVPPLGSWTLVGGAIYYPAEDYIDLPSASAYAQSPLFYMRAAGITISADCSATVPAQGRTTATWLLNTYYQDAYGVVTANSVGNTANGDASAAYSPDGQWHRATRVFFLGANISLVRIRLTATTTFQPIYRVRRLTVSP